MLGLRRSASDEAASLLYDTVLELEDTLLDASVAIGTLFGTSLDVASVGFPAMKSVFRHGKCERSKQGCFLLDGSSSHGFVETDAQVFGVDVHVVKDTTSSVRISNVDQLNNEEVSMVEDLLAQMIIIDEIACVGLVGGLVEKGKAGIGQGSFQATDNLLFGVVLRVIGHVLDLLVLQTIEALLWVEVFEQAVHACGASDAQRHDVFWQG